MDIVIRAGGAGTRLWPWSRRSVPKQFQQLFGSRTMIAETIARIEPLLTEGGALWVSVNEAAQSLIKKEIPNLDPHHLIVEPEARNTAAAICLEICVLEKSASLETVIATLPSDDFISNQEAFLDLLRSSEQFITEHPEYIIAPAVKPDYPEVGYSYLKAGLRLDTGGREAMLAVDSMVEKPNREYCEELIADGLHYWHTGMYVWRLGRIIELFESFQPKMIESCRRIADLREKNGNEKEIRDIFSSLEKITIEAAITHHTETIAMSVSNHVGWSDVGKWPAVKRLGVADEFGNVIQGEVLVHKAQDNIVYNRSSKKLVVLNNVKNIAVIETDDVLVVSDLDSTEDIKEILERLAREGKEQYL